MNNKVIYNYQKPVSEMQPPTHINTISEKEVKKAAEIKNIVLSGQTIVENTPENSSIQPEKNCNLTQVKLPLTMANMVVGLQVFQE